MSAIHSGPLDQLCMQIAFAHRYDSMSMCTCLRLQRDATVEVLLGVRQNPAYQWRIPMKAYLQPVLLWLHQVQQTQ